MSARRELALCAVDLVVLVLALAWLVGCGGQGTPPWAGDWVSSGCVVQTFSGDVRPAAKQGQALRFEPSPAMPGAWEAVAGSGPGGCPQLWSWDGADGGELIPQGPCSPKAGIVLDVSRGTLRGDEHVLFLEASGTVVANGDPGTWSTVDSGMR